MTSTVYVVNPENNSLSVLDEPMWYPDPLVSYGITSIDYFGKEFTDPDEIYRTQRAVRTVVNFIAKNFAQVELQGFSLKEDGDRDRLAYGDKLAKTLRSPDGVHTAYEFGQERVKDLCLWERWAAFKELQPDGSIQLRRLPPRLWRFVRNGRDVPTGIRINDKVHDLELFLWMDGYAASEKSPMAHLSELLCEERVAAEYRRSLMERGGRFEGVITRPVEAPEWGSKGRERFRQGWIQAYTGRGATRAGGTPILEDGMEYVPVKGVSPRDTQAIEARKLATAEAASAFGIAPQLVGVTGDANYSNVIAYRQMLYDDTLGPLFMQDKQAWNLRLVPDLKADGSAFVEHNVGEKLRLSFEEQAAVLSTAVGGPWLSRNEARRRQNLARIEGADLLIEPLNVGVLDPNKTAALDEDDLATVEKVQKVYLGVGTVIDRDEARAMLGLPPAKPGQFPDAPAAPAPIPTGDES